MDDIFKDDDDVFVDSDKLSSKPSASVSVQGSKPSNIVEWPPNEDPFVDDEDLFGGDLDIGSPDKN